jgi:hypothetical protein
MKTMLDNLHDLDAYIDDRTLILNLLQGLNKKFESLKTVMKRTKPLPSFRKVRNDLLAELMLDTEATFRSAFCLHHLQWPTTALAYLHHLRCSSRSASLRQWRWRLSLA